MTTRTNPRTVAGWPYTSTAAHAITQAMVLAVRLDPTDDDPIKLADVASFVATHLVDHAVQARISPEGGGEH